LARPEGAGIAAGVTPRTYANPQVLGFYRDLPFGYRGTTREHVDPIIRTDPASLHPPLDPLLRPEMRVLDVGCGVGWLSSAIAHHRQSRVTGIDFNPVVIERAREIAAAVGVAVEFEVADLFLYEPDAPADLTVSVGVLHHTDNCHVGIRRVSEAFTRPRGHFYIGLYHAYGRRPFLDHFQTLKERDVGEDELLAEYRLLHSALTDETHARAWFRDQVLHPKETQHTLQEILPIIESCGATLLATSVNRFERIDSVDELFEQEVELERYAAAQLEAGRFYPGFFTVLCRREA
jgi:SAM-dependent methyltransferase